MKRRFTDSAEVPIIAWDFDGTINVGGEGTYPICGKPRKYAKEVMNILHLIGVKNVMWTSRDIAYNQDDGEIHDHVTPMIKFLNANDIKYHAINKSVQFAPYPYNGRKIYAHMYIDDRAFGWKEHDFIMLEVLMHICIDILGIGGIRIIEIIDEFKANDGKLKEDTLHELKEYVEHWKD